MNVVVLNQFEKHALVARYATPYGILVETGLYNGSGVSTALADSMTCYAIDLQRENVDKARSAGVEAFQGDSAVMLPQLLRRIDRPVCFWLDAHLATEGGDDVDAAPILQELDAILDWPPARASTLLVDDLRMFGRGDWPTVEHVRVKVGNVWVREEADDIMRLTPR